jgi:hypothetical protein
VSIVSHHDFEGERLYMVKWADDESKNSEIPYENMVTQYYKELNKANSHAPATRPKCGANAMS